MSASFSFSQIGGVLGRDPESKSTSTGKKVVNFSVAVDDGYGDRKVTHWFNVVAWNQQAEFAEKYLKKGKPVVISGKLQTRSWEDKATGQTRTVVEINAQSIGFQGFDKQESKPTQKPVQKTDNSDPFADDIAF